MLTQTSETAVRALIYLVLIKSTDPVTPRQIAESLGTSPTYMAKITRQLVRANILRSHRGAAGGVSLSKDPANVTLLEIIEASQGLLVGNYCDEIKGHTVPLCAFHQAMKETHELMIKSLTSWTLEKLSSQPGPSGDEQNEECRMGFIGTSGKVFHQDCGKKSSSE
jgi:Rrf2 family transcriptional regulator, nitric oxide-sensitive transcriptional repressor